MKRILLPFFASLVLAAVPGCIIPALDTGTGLGGSGSQNLSGAGSIVVNGVSANPSSTATKGDKITFTIDAYDTQGLAMQYSWSATKGHLSATEGQTVYWSPLNSSGQLDQGLATVQVLVSDSSGASKVASVNLEIAPDGTAQTTTATSPSPSPSPSPDPSPSTQPVPSPTPATGSAPTN